MRVPPNGCFIGKIPLNPIKMDDLGVSLFQETSILDFRAEIEAGRAPVTEPSLP